MCIRKKKINKDVSAFRELRVPRKRFCLPTRSHLDEFWRIVLESVRRDFEGDDAHALHTHSWISYKCECIFMRRSFGPERPTDLWCSLAPLEVHFSPVFYEYSSRNWGDACNTPRKSPQVTRYSQFFDGHSKNRHASAVEPIPSTFRNKPHPNGCLCYRNFTQDSRFLHFSRNRLRFFLLTMKLVIDFGQVFDDVFKNFGKSYSRNWRQIIGKFQSDSNQLSKHLACVDDRERLMCR